MKTRRGRASDMTMARTLPRALLLGFLLVGCTSDDGADDEQNTLDGAATEGGDDDGGDDDGDADETEGESDGADGGDADPDGGPDGTADDGDPTDTGGGDVVQDVEPLIAALCEWEFGCCDDGERGYRLGPFTTGAEDCTARFMQQLVSNDIDPASPRSDLLFTLGYTIDLASSAPNPEAIDACAAAMGARPCNEWSGTAACVPPSGPPADDPCRLDNLFTGLLPAGEECNPALAPWADVECVPGTVCQAIGDDWTCVDKGGPDEFCRADATCLPGLYCDIAHGRCALRAGDGEACEFADDSDPVPGTETIHCREDLTCDPQSGTCAAYCTERYRCGADGQCPLGQSCVPHPEIGAGYAYCAPIGAAGDACDSHRDCEDGLHCFGDYCLADLAVDVSCDFDAQCTDGLYCQNICRALKPEGELCGDDRECDPESTIGCITSADGRRCRGALLPNGVRCADGENAGGNWCISGVCERIADDGVVLAACHEGAQLGEPCDNANSQDIHRCAVGLYCADLEAGVGHCEAMVGPGEVCAEDGDQQCLGGHCGAAWDGDYCSDAPSVLAEDAVTCDGV
ncbi:MAG: hypothetical protein AAF721_18570 [Myxococcota bacterium]